MPVYIVTGKLGSGKTLAMVGRLQKYIVAGKPVATNIELDNGWLRGLKPTAPIWRLADRPSVDDLSAIGDVHSTGQEEQNGALVLDECGAWLNARTWADGKRAAFIDWMLHSRKKGWDVYLIVQSLTMLDKQLREGIGEYTVICRRMDRITIPGIGRVARFLSGGILSGKLPKVHLCAVRYGNGPSSMHAETWYFRGTELYGAYRTVQVMAMESAPARLVDWADVPAPAARVVKPKLERVALLMRLPPDERVPVVRRWISNGMLPA